MDGSLVNALISTLMQSVDTIAPLVQWVDISPGLGIHGVGRNLTLHLLSHCHFHQGTGEDHRNHGKEEGRDASSSKTWLSD